MSHLEVRSERRGRRKASRVTETPSFPSSSASQEEGEEGSDVTSCAIAEVRPLARRETTCRNFGILCMAFHHRSMPTPSGPSREEIVPSPCKLSPRSNGLRFLHGISPRRFYSREEAPVERALLSTPSARALSRGRNFVAEKLRRIFSLLTRDHRLASSILWHTNTTSIENFHGRLAPRHAVGSTTVQPPPSSIWNGKYISRCSDTLSLLAHLGVQTIE